MSNSKEIAEAIIGNLDEFRTNIHSTLSDKILGALDEKKREIATGLFGGKLNEGKNMGPTDHAGDANAKWGDKLERDEKKRKKAKVKIKTKK
jgi:hypothetical protein